MWSHMEIVLNFSALFATLLIVGHEYTKKYVKYLKTK